MSKFAGAVDELQRQGWTTSLSKGEEDAWTLRWEKRGAAWRTTARGVGWAECIGKNAISWLLARYRGNGREENYAVWDRKRTKV